MTAVEQLDQIAARYRSGAITSLHAHYLTGRALAERDGEEPSAWDCVVALADATTRVMGQAASTPQP